MPHKLYTIATHRAYNTNLNTFYAEIINNGQKNLKGPPKEHLTFTWNFQLPDSVPREFRVDVLQLKIYFHTSTTTLIEKTLLKYGYHINASSHSLLEAGMLRISC